MPLRPEVLRQDRPDGGLTLYDPLLERLHELDPAPAARLRAGDASVEPWLAERLLAEGPHANALRDAVIASRRLRPPLAPPARTLPAVDWGACDDLPDGVATRWRDGERLRRLAEERLAGRAVVILRGFLAPSAAQVLARQVAALPFERLETAHVQASRHHAPGGIAGLGRLFGDPLLRQLLGAILGVELPAGATMNAWRLEPGDHLRVHPDGPRYRATFALGLCADWTAADGGAIAFGRFDAAGDFEVGERFLPHLGDLCLFVPGPTTWHQVEPPARTRLSLSGWWVDG